MKQNFAMTDVLQFLLFFWRVLKVLSQSVTDEVSR